MLAVQVQYWTLQETIRHDKVTEQETQRHNIAQETYWSNTLQETIRHNQAQEGYWAASLAEETRHHAEEEAIGWGNIELGYANVALGYTKAKVDYLNAQTRHEANVVKQRELNLKTKEYQWNKQMDQRNFNFSVMKEQVNVAQWATDNITNLMNRGSGVFKSIFK